MVNLQIPKISSSKKSSGVLNFVIQFLVVGMIFFALGFALGQKKAAVDKKSFIPHITFTNQAPASRQTVDFSLFWQVFDTLPQKYLDKTAIDGQKILYGAISGMVKSLGDPYTAFLDPKQNQAITEELSGSFQGVGIQIGFNKDKRLVVIAPLKGTPAEAAGIRAKDLILKVDKKDTFDMTLPEAVDLIRGNVGTKVTLTLMHAGDDKPYEREIQRGQINVKSVEVEFKDSKRGKIAVVHVSRFGETTDREWDSAVSSVLASNVYGVIVDMRNNPGGLLTSGIHLASEFVTGTVVKQATADGTVTSLGADHNGRLLSIPLEVLVNGGSASAAEIFSGAIADNHRGKLIGERTFGKGSVQDVVPFAGGSALHVTFAKWLTPAGTSIHNVGIGPDVIIEAKSDDKLDMQLEKALDLF